MAVAGAVKLEVIAKAQENIRAVLKQSNNAIKQSASELKKAGVAQTRMGAAVAKAIRGQGKFRASLVRSADGLSKLGSKLGSAKAAMGALAGALALGAFRDFIIAGEKAANVAARFADTAGGTSESLRQMKEATAGLVEETELQVIANRFARLGLPIKQTTRLLELATKAAIDQGREVTDVARVIESSLKGRTTGLIDIGVNIDKITGLTKEYAAQTGVAVGELDEMDRRLKVALPAALQALGEQFGLRQLRLRCSSLRRGGLVGRLESRRKPHDRQHRGARGSVRRRSRAGSNAIAVDGSHVRGRATGDGDQGSVL